MAVAMMKMMMARRRGIGAALLRSSPEGGASHGRRRQRAGFSRSIFTFVRSVSLAGKRRRRLEEEVGAPHMASSPMPRGI